MESTDSSSSDTATLNNDNDNSGSDTATLNEGTADTEALTVDSTFNDPAYAKDFAPVEDTEVIEEAAPAAPPKSGTSGTFVSGSGGSGESIASMGYFLWLASASQPPPPSLRCEDKSLWNKTSNTTFNGTVCQNHSAGSVSSIYLLLMVFGMV